MTAPIDEARLRERSLAQSVESLTRYVLHMSDEADRTSLIEVLDALSAERERGDVAVGLLDQQADNLAFVMNRTYLHNWSEKFDAELAEARAFLAAQKAEGA